MAHESDIWRIMNNDTELGLTLGYNIPSIQTRSRSINNNNNNNNNDDSGAGVNAGSSINMAFAASTPLSELVWSPSKGLSLKCADRRSAILWDVGPSNNITFPDHSVISKSSNDEEKSEAKETFMPENDMGIQPAVEAGFDSTRNLRRFGKLFGSSSHEGQTQNDNNSREVNSVEDVKDACPNRVKNEKESLSGLKNMQLDNLGETSVTYAGKVNKRTTDLLPFIDTASKPERTSGNSEKIEAIATSSRPLGLEIAMDTQSQPVEEVELEIQNEGHDQNSDPLPETLESSAENNFPDQQDDNESSDSLESCSSRAGLFSNGKKRWGFEPTATSSKRMKTQFFGSGDPTRRPLPDSSFMNWISNMVKGVPKSNHKRCVFSNNTTDNLAGKTTGFQTIFQSIHNTDSKSEESKPLYEERTAPSEIAGPSSVRPLFITSNDKNDRAENILESKSSDEKEIENMGYATDPHCNLWITRFSTKTPILNHKGPSKESSMGLKKVGIDELHDSTLRLNPFTGSKKLNSSGEMASVFAKRLDSLKHIMSSDIKNHESQSKKVMTCFFCGKSGHELRECSEVKKTELKDLVGRNSSYNGTEQPQCFCIRCFQFDHWAVTCPFASPSRLSNSNLKFMSDNERGNLDAPKAMFDKIKKLRLTRADILKWMRSGSSLAHLDGFFVRLRLGKYDGGLGGTGYYVACITDMERGKSSKESGNSIGISVGYIKCFVETKYVSNQDFLEDELVTWWKMVSKSEEEIPCETELKLKFEERKRLGL